MYGVQPAVERDDCYYVVVVGGLFTAIVPVTDLVARREQTERRRDDHDSQRGYDNFPRTRRTQLSVRVEHAPQYTHLTAHRARCSTTSTSVLGHCSALIGDPSNTTRDNGPQSTTQPT